jgi:tetratricopeptide (TPR) repeat protein
MPGESPVAPFHPPRNSAEASRDLGVALSEITRGLDSSQAGHLADIAMPLVLKACDASPHDHEAHEAAAQIFRVQRRHADSLMALDHLLADGYERERVLVEAASLAAGMGQEQKAIDYWKRAIAISPHVAYYHWQLARILSVKGDWPATLASIEKSLKIDPFNTEARVLLVTGLFRLGKRGEAKTELERTVALSPKDSTRLREWFDRLSR